MKNILSIAVASTFAALTLAGGMNALADTSLECTEKSCIVHKTEIFGSLGDNCEVNEIILNYLNSKRALPSCVDLEKLEDDLAQCREGNCISFLYGIFCDSGEAPDNKPDAPDNDNTTDELPPIIDLPDFELPDNTPEEDGDNGNDEAPIVPEDKPETEKPNDNNPSVPDNGGSNSGSGGVNKPSDNGQHSAFISEVVRLVNKERAAYGLSSVTAGNSALSKAAATRASEQAKSFSHTRPDGSKWTTVLSQYGVSYKSAGENVAYGQDTPSEVMSAWMNSDGHRANILNGSYTEIGVGVYYKNGTYYWSQLFIS